MADTKYGHLVQPLPVKKGPGNANAKQLVWMRGDEMNGLELNFAWGVYEGLGNWHEWAPGGGPHTHPYPEALVFVGHDTDDLTYLGAELEIAMGVEQEKHVIKEASVVIVPAGMVHCPLVATKVEKPYSHYHVALSAKVNNDWLKLEGEPEKTDGTKYGHLVKPLPIRKGPGGANADHIAWLRGETLEGMNVNFTWGSYSGLGDWEPGRDPHVHPYGEALVFVGHNTDDLTYLGAELELCLGKEQEKHKIDKASVVTVPGGMVHCPLVTTKVDRPFSFFLIALDAEPSYTWLGPDGDKPRRPPPQT
ncbi:hypothetical protein ACFLYN_00990 [Chloroflexota bacterium]